MTVPLAILRRSCPGLVNSLVIFLIRGTPSSTRSAEACTALRRSLFKPGLLLRVGPALLPFVRLAPPLPEPRLAFLPAARVPFTATPELPFSTPPLVPPLSLVPLVRFPAFPDVLPIEFESAPVALRSALPPFFAASLPQAAILVPRTVARSR